MVIGFVRDKQQGRILRMFTFEGQDVIKTMVKVMFINYYVSNYVKTKGTRKVTCAVHVAHWV